MSDYETPFRIVQTVQIPGLVTLMYGDSVLAHIEGDKITEDLLRVVRQAYIAGYSDCSEECEAAVRNVLSVTPAAETWVDKRPEIDEEA